MPKNEPYTFTIFSLENLKTLFGLSGNTRQETDVWGQIQSTINSFLELTSWQGLYFGWVETQSIWMGSESRPFKTLQQWCHKREYVLQILWLKDVQLVGKVKKDPKSLWKQTMFFQSGRFQLMVHIDHSKLYDYLIRIIVNIS